MKIHYILEMLLAFKKKCSPHFLKKGSKTVKKTQLFFEIFLQFCLDLRRFSPVFLGLATFLWNNVMYLCTIDDMKRC